MDEALPFSPLHIPFLSFSIFINSNTSHFFSFSTFLCSTSSHFLPHPFFSIPIHPIFPFLSPTPLTSSHSPLSFASPHPIFSHFPFSLFQYTPFFPPFTPTHPTPPYFLLPFSPTPLTSSHPSLSLLQRIPFSPTSLFLYSNTPHSSTFPFPIFQHLPPSLFHPMFSFLQNQTTCTAQKYLFSKIQNQKIPLSFPNAARPSQNHHLLSPTKKINAHPASPKTPFFKIFAYPIFPLNFLNSLFLPIPFFPTKTKKG